MRAAGYWAAAGLREDRAILVCRHPEEIETISVGIQLSLHLSWILTSLRSSGLWRDNCHVNFPGLLAKTI